MYTVFIDGHKMVGEISIFSEIKDAIAECVRLANEQIGHTFEVYFLQKLGSARTEPAEYVRLDKD